MMILMRDKAQGSRLRLHSLVAKGGIDVSSKSLHLHRLSIMCPSCSTSLSVRSIHAGHPVRCARCHQRFSIPETLEPGTNPAAGHVGRPVESTSPRSDYHPNGN